VKIEILCAVDKGHFDEVSSQISIFEGFVEIVGGVERLMNITNNMKQISSHECPLKSDTFFVGFKDTFAPVYCVDRVDILLIRGHSLEGVVRIVYAAFNFTYMFVKW